VAFPSGISHHLEKLAFNATAGFTSKDQILQKLEKFGGICDCQSTRQEFLFYILYDLHRKKPSYTSLTLTFVCVLQLFYLVEAGAGTVSYTQLF
jgi:processing peptidase subunit alpha